MPRRGPPPRSPQHLNRSPAREASPDGERVFGLRAAAAVLTHRSGDVLRVAVARGLATAEVSNLGALLRGAAARGVRVEEQSDGALDALAGGPHHEGIVVTTGPRRWASPTDLATRLVSHGAGRGPGVAAAVALDRVRNPYNVGAILRSAAFFGLRGALLGSPAPHPALAPLAVRVSEGGAEELLLARTTDLAGSLERLRGAGVKVLAAESDGTEPLFDHPMTCPTVVVMGHEREGISPRVRAQCDAVVTIPGSATVVGSLNVSVAAAVMFAEMLRQRGAARPSGPGPQGERARAASSRTKLDRR